MSSYHEISTAENVSVTIGPNAKSLVIKIDDYTIHVAQVTHFVLRDPRIDEVARLMSLSVSPVRPAGCQSLDDKCDFPDCPCDKPHGYSADFIAGLVVATMLTVLTGYLVFG